MIIDAHSVHTEKMVKAQHEEERQRHSAAQLRKFLWAALVTIVILLAGMSGLMVAVVAAFKDTKADGSVLANNEGMVMETSLASINLPLVAAPAMDLQRLAQVSSVSVTLYVMNGTMPPFLNAPIFADQVRTPRHTTLAAPWRGKGVAYPATQCTPALGGAVADGRLLLCAHRSATSALTSQRWSGCTP